MRLPTALLAALAFTAQASANPAETVRAEIVGALEESGCAMERGDLFDLLDALEAEHGADAVDAAIAPLGESEAVVQLEGKALLTVGDICGKTRETVMASSPRAAAIRALETNGCWFHVAEADRVFAGEKARRSDIESALAELGAAGEVETNRQGSVHRLLTGETCAPLAEDKPTRITAKLTHGLVRDLEASYCRFKYPTSRYVDYVIETSIARGIAAVETRDGNRELVLQIGETCGGPARATADAELARHRQVFTQALEANDCALGIVPLTEIFAAENIPAARVSIEMTQGMERGAGTFGKKDGRTAFVLTSGEVCGK